eukprot:TRINITY_DN21936_c0_g1_i1.p1 TRINITY_DN21936_c0_g1~~TRINITY_DN21936_c0_g1_i1.p1  ORF type:complete len:214 (+),score=53.55 TRINITY_DN21936_c0_g1_i1:29-643(+)
MAASGAGYVAGADPLASAPVIAEALLSHAAAAAAASATAGEGGEEEKELRKKLEAYTEARGKEVARRELGNALKILGRLEQDPGNSKLHEMRKDVLERTVGEGLYVAFEAAGFEQRPASETSDAVFTWRGGDAADHLKTTVFELQRASDMCLDPDTVSFIQVSEIVQSGRQLPGIQEVDDKVREPLTAKESALPRPKKPWERNE